MSGLMLKSKEPGPMRVKSKLPGPMLVPEINAGLAAAPVQSCAVVVVVVLVVAVPGSDFGETLPSLVLGPLQRKSQPAGLGLVVWVEG